MTKAVLLETWPLKKDTILAKQAHLLKELARSNGTKQKIFVGGVDAFLQNKLLLKVS